MSARPQQARRAAWEAGPESPCPAAETAGQREEPRRMRRYAECVRPNCRPGGDPNEKGRIGLSELGQAAPLPLSRQDFVHHVPGHVG